MSLEAAILGFLSERPRSGYDLKTRCFDHDARFIWTADQAQIYRTLERLQGARLISSTRKRQAGRPDRRVYEITPAGRDALTAWLRESPALASARDPLLLWLYFAAALPEGELLDVIESRRSRHQTRLDALRGEAVLFAQETGSTAREAALRGSAFEGAIAQERTTIDWLDDIAEAIRSGQLPGAGEPLQSQQHLFGTGSA